MPWIRSVKFLVKFYDIYIQKLSNFKSIFLQLIQVQEIMDDIKAKKTEENKRVKKIRELQGVVKAFEEELLTTTQNVEDVQVLIANVLLIYWNL